jgi:hypothetical protein
VLQRLTRAPFALGSAGSQKQRRRGLVLLLEWLSEQPGASWQDRWLASGADAAGARWRQIPAQWLRECGHDAEGQHAVLGAALTVAICAQVVRPGLAWLVAAVPRGGAPRRCPAEVPRGGAPRRCPAEVPRGGAPRRCPGAMHGPDP